MFKKRAINDRKILILVRLLDASKKFLIFLALFGQLWSIVPWNSLQVKASIDLSQELSTDGPSLAKYPTTSDSDFEQSKVAIQSEIIDDRTATSKTFRKIDGTYEIAVYNDVIHYQENGEWKQIDNSLNDLGDELENKANHFKVKFPKKLDDNKQIKLTLDSYSIDWNVLNINSSSVSYDDTKIDTSNIKELPNINQSVLYSNIQPYADIEYIITGSKVKENIILSQYVSDFSMTFAYKLKDLELVQGEHGEVYFTNGSNEIVFSIKDLYMIDSDYNESFDIDIDVVKTGHKTYLLKVTPSDNWLGNASYPVKIDPTISLSGDLGYLKDKYTYGTTGSNSTSNFIKSGNSGTYRYRSYFEIDLSIIPIDTNVTYSHLELDVYQTSNYCDLDCQINIREVKEYIEFDSIKGSDDNNIDNSIDNSIDIEDRIIDYRMVNKLDSVQHYYFDITELLFKWQNNDDDKRIIELRNEDETIVDYVFFDSTENSSGIKPLLEIGYIDSTGLKDYWTYSNQNAGLAGGGYVSDFTGKLTFIRNDLSFSTERQSLSSSFTYNQTQLDSDVGYGLGWQSGYNIKVTPIIEDEEYMITDSSGNKTHYYSTSCDYRITDEYPMNYECFIAEDGSGNIYVRGYYDDGIYFYLADQYVLTMNQMLYSFGYDGYLSTIHDRETHQSIIISRNSSYKDQITRIRDQVGNKIDFVYDNDLLVESILSLKQADETFNPIEKIKYYYDSTTVTGKNVLDTIEYYKNYDSAMSMTLDVTANYSYYSDGKLNEAYIIDGVKVEYGYENDKVSIVTSYFGSSIYGQLSYNYGLLETTITDHNNKFIIYKFDTYGHTVNMIDSFGNAQFFKYLNLFKYEIHDDINNDQVADILFINAEPNYNNNHKLVSKSNPIKTIINPVSNHSFEQENILTAGARWNLYVNGVFEDGSHLSLPIVTDEESLFGTQSVKLDYNLLSGYMELRQDVLLKDDIYTLIAYVKNDSNGDDAFIEVKIDRNGTIETFTSDTVTNDGGWHEVRLQFDTDADYEDVTISLKNGNIGAVFFDNIQIMNGFTDTRLNQLDDSSFELSTPESSGWSNMSSPNISLFDHTSMTTEFEQSMLGSHSIEIIGDPTQIIATSNAITDMLNFGLANGTLVVGGWAKSEGTPTSMAYQSGMDVNDINRLFRINVKIYGDGMVLLHEYYIDFDPMIEGWQYVLEEIALDDDVEFVQIALEYQGEGKVYFDALQVYYERMNTDYVYDSNGHLISKTDSSYVSTIFEYGNLKDNRPTKIIQGNKIIELSTIDDDSFVEEITVNNVHSDPTYNYNGQVTSLIIGDTNSDYFSTSTTYLSTGFNQYIQLQTNEFGKTTTFYHDTLTGLLKAIEDAKGEDLYYEYDNEGKLVRVISLTDHNFLGSNVHGYIEYEYDSQDRLEYIIMNKDASGNPLYFYKIVYDGDRMKSVYVNSQKLMEYTYQTDVNGTYETNRIDSQEYGNGDKIEFIYTDEGQIGEVWFGNYEEDTFKEFSYEYDQSGNLAIFNTYSYDSFSEEYEVIYSEYYSYDSAGRIKQVVDQEGNLVKYQYDSDGNLSSIYFNIDGNSSNTNYFHNQCFSYTGSECTSTSSLFDKTQYNSQSSLAIIKDYEYESSAMYRLDYINLITGTTNLFKQDFVYEDITTNGTTSIRIKEIQYNIHNDESIDYQYVYSYDSLGNIVMVKYYEGGTLKITESYVYDALNQLIIESIRDEDYLITELSDTNYTKYFYYNEYRNITDIKTFLYGQTDRIEIIIPEGFMENYGTYWIDYVLLNDIYEPGMVCNIDINSQFTPTFSFFADAGNTDITDLLTIEYDQYAVDTSTAGYYLIEGYASDDFGDYAISFGFVIKVGNPSSLRTPQHHIEFTYDDIWKDQLISYGVIDYINGIPQTVVTSHEYIYDDQGNPIEITNFFYNDDNPLTDNYWHHAKLEYDGRQLASITIYNSAIEIAANEVIKIQYTYDDQGFRIGKEIGNSKIEYKLQGDKVIYETDGTYEIIYTYDYDGTIISFEYRDDTHAWKEYFFMRDQQGDITKIVDKDGTIIVEYQYDAWGNIISKVDNSGFNLSDINAYTYRGYRYDSEINLYYLNSRYYNPEIGRFINADGLTGNPGNKLSNNMYIYVDNNPIMGYDPTGMFNWGIFWKVTGGVVGAVVATVIVAASGGTTIPIIIAITSGYIIGSNIATVIESEIYINNSDVSSMDSARAEELLSGNDTTGLSRDEKLGFIYYLQENYSDRYSNWTTGEMLREFEYHDRLYNSFSCLGFESDINGNWIERQVYKAQYVDFETTQTTKTYIRRIFGNAWPFGD
ncbi:MAG: hypothetical protein CVV57_04600 [Tenericutes bacterium HGW-Tenericutes-2]|jgi:RHS repeat-associated protein|nr:MAG: hypothetical protein CVV57_04600 [Tenericutes bacterium HGW-Tenericutes-2]